MAIQEQKPYAKYEVLPTLGNNIVSNLINNTDAEIIWKLLKDKTPDAWNITNLTKAEKRALIYKGSEDAQNFAVFFDSGMDNVIADESIYLRIYPYSGKPLDPYTGIVDIAFEMLCHYKLNTLSNYTTRVDSIMSAILNCLNGADIGGLGCLYFDAHRSSNNKFQNFNQVPFKAKILIMGVNVA